MRSVCCLFFMFFLITAKTQDIGFACENGYNSQQWDVALTACKEILKTSIGPEVEIKVLDQLAHITSSLHLANELRNYDKRIQQHPLFIEESPYHYRWLRRKGKQAFFDRNLEDAELFFNQALAVGVAQENNTWQSKSHNDLGILSNHNGRFSEALLHYQKSLELKLALGDELIIANTLYNIGSLLLKLERSDDAIDYLKRSIESFKKHAEIKPESYQLGRSESIEHVYEDLIVAYLKTDKTEDAQNLLVDIAEAQTDGNENITNFTTEHASTNLALAKFYASIDRPKLAQRLLDKAKEKAPKENLLSFILLSAKIQQLLNDSASSLQIAKEGLEKSLNMNDLFYISAFNQFISTIVERDDPVSALNYLKSSYAAREQFLHQKYSNDINTINFEIKNRMVERDLFHEQLLNTRNEKKILKLGNQILIYSILLITTTAFFVYFYLTKKREKLRLLESIEYHKKQLLLLDTDTSGQELTQHKIKPKQQLKQVLVKAMVEAVDVWSRHTGRGRVDLADSSKVWTITVDNGVLRTRSMDKYLSVKHIPENPRWRKVVRTCHYLLSDSTLKHSDRDLMSRNLEDIMKLIKELK